LSGDEKIVISKRAHLILPSYKLLDQKLESLKGDKVGTTGRGIGPAYAFKAFRFGVRVGDLFQDGLEEKLSEIRRLVESLNVEWIQPDVNHWKEVLAPYVGDDYKVLHEAYLEGRRILFEAAQAFYWIWILGPIRLSRPATLSRTVFTLVRVLTQKSLVT